MLDRRLNSEKFGNSRNSLVWFGFGNSNSEPDFRIPQTPQFIMIFIKKFNEVFKLRNEEVNQLRYISLHHLAVTGELIIHYESQLRNYNSLLICQKSLDNVTRLFLRGKHLVNLSVSKVSGLQ